MSVRAFAACTIAALLWSSAAAAASVTNRDDKDFKVTVIEGDAKQAAAQIAEVLRERGVLGD